MGQNRVVLQNSSFLKNASADFAQNFTNERWNPTYCYYEILYLLMFFWNIIPNKMDAFLLSHGVYHIVAHGA